MKPFGLRERTLAAKAIKQAIMDYPYHPEIKRLSKGRIQVGNIVCPDHFYYDIPRQANLISDRARTTPSLTDYRIELSQVAHGGQLYPGGERFSKTVRFAIQRFLFEEEIL